MDGKVARVATNDYNYYSDPSMNRLRRRTFHYDVKLQFLWRSNGSQTESLRGQISWTDTTDTWVAEKDCSAF